MSHTHIYCKRQTDFNFARVRLIFIYYDFKSYPPVSLESSFSGDTCDKSYKLLYTYMSHVITWCHVIQVTWLAVVQSIPSVKNKPKLELNFLSIKKITSWSLRNVVILLRTDSSKNICRFNSRKIFKKTSKMDGICTEIIRFGRLFIMYLLLHNSSIRVKSSKNSILNGFINFLVDFCLVQVFFRIR